MTRSQWARVINYYRFRKIIVVSETRTNRAVRRNRANNRKHRRVVGAWRRTTASDGAKLLLLRFVVIVHYYYTPASARGRAGRSFRSTERKRVERVVRPSGCPRDQPARRRRGEQF